MPVTPRLLVALTLALALLACGDDSGRPVSSDRSAAVPYGDASNGPGFERAQPEGGGAEGPAAPVPEPGTLLLVGTGMFVVAAARRRRALTRDDGESPPPA